MNVSRETLARFSCWHDLLHKWSKKINLVASGTLPAFWTRHALDSAQLAPLVPNEARRLIDLGSGAGFPGLAIALMRMEDHPVHVTLVESNAKKAAFLRVCIEETGAPAEVICARSESLPPQDYDVITARALAPLPRLLALCAPFVGPQTLQLFLKGAEVEKEIGEARKDWALAYETIPSMTEKTASILKIRKAYRV
ncbi:MAG: 16S rRNA (guanine(527)-N(7))-methyltransferase RsmG [Robiginitomaculum sp.]|nr:MAG: 16S rRNA (guanine(527)-N(7))-methyltransferase RsmG [Robiginitomaculum sp.]